MSSFRHRTCCICQTKKETGISFFGFPANEARAKQWLEAINDPYLNGLDIKKLRYQFICARHFQEKDFPNTLHTRLSKFAVPSLYLKRGMEIPYPVLLQTNDNYKVDLSSVQQQDTAANTDSSLPSRQEVASSNNVAEGFRKGPSDAAVTNIPTASSNKTLPEMPSTVIVTRKHANKTKSLVDAATEITEESLRSEQSKRKPSSLQNSATFTFSHGSTISQNEHTFTNKPNMTGMGNSKETNAEQTLPSYFQYRSLSEQKLKLYTGLSKEIIDTLLKLMQQVGVTVKCSLDTAEQMLLVLMRLKLGLLIEDLADRFGISPSIANKIFKGWIYAMKTVLGNAVHCLCEETIEECCPSEIRINSSNKCILDCIELFIQKNTVHRDKDQIYSLYRIYKTTKIFIAISSSGYITGVSSCHRRKADEYGTMSDKFIKMLQSQDKVIVNQSLQAEHELSQIGDKVASPSCPRNHEQCKGMQEFLYVERILKKVKSYNILNTALPVRKVSSVEDMVLVISALVNLKLPILKRLIMDAENNDMHLCLKCKRTVIGEENFEIHQTNKCMSVSQNSLLNIMESSKWKRPAIVHCKAVEPFSGLKLHNEVSFPKRLALEPVNEQNQSLFGNNKAICSKSSALLDHLITDDKLHEAEGTRAESNFDSPTTTRNCQGVKNSAVTLDENSHILSLSDKSFPTEKGKEVAMPVNRDNFIKLFTRQCFDVIKCETCNEVFVTKLDWMEHVLSKRHRERFKYIETWYSFVFSEEKFLIYSSLFQCSICHFYFNNSEEFNTHLNASGHTEKIAQLDRPLLCVPCNVECPLNGDLLQHVFSENHKESVRFVSQFHPVVIIEKGSEDVCRYCNNTCYMMELHGQHDLMSSADVSSERVCPHCNTPVSDIVDMKGHVKKCRTYDTSFLSKKEMHDHFYCIPHKKRSLDQKAANRIRIYESEHNKMTKDKKEHCCMYCNKTFVTNNVLKHHIFTHTGEKPYVCDICGRGFSQSGAHYTHRMLHFAVVKDLKCKKCEFRTYRKALLWKHEQIHNIIRPRNFLCEICGAAFYYKGYLTRHMQYHNGCIHKCSYAGCHRAFSTPFELTIHTRIHTNEKPFLCDICGYSARCHNALKLHHNRHFEQKRYQCHYCPYNTTFLSRIQKHVLKTNNHFVKSAFLCKFCEYEASGMKEYREHLLENHIENFPGGERQFESLLLSNIEFKTLPVKRRGKRLSQYVSKPSEREQKINLKTSSTHTNKQKKMNIEDSSDLETPTSIATYKDIHYRTARVSEGTSTSHINASPVSENTESDKCIISVNTECETNAASQPLSFDEVVSSTISEDCSILAYCKTQDLIVEKKDDAQIEEILTMDSTLYSVLDSNTSEGILICVPYIQNV